MSVRIRLARMGAKRKPFYRLVAANSEAPRDGKFLEILGTYDPMKDPAQISIQKERIKDWMEKGASLSGSAKAILKDQGVF